MSKVKEIDVLRRQILIALGASFALPVILARSESQDTCEYLRAMNTAVEVELSKVDTWASGRGRQLVEKLRKDIQGLEDVLPRQSRQLKDAQRRLLLTRLSAVINTTMLILGIALGTKYVAGLIAANMLVSTSVLILKGATGRPEDLRPIEEGGMVVGRLTGYVLDGAAASEVVVASRTVVLDVAGKLVSGIMALYDAYNAVQDGQNLAAISQKLSTTHERIDELTAVLVELEEPNALENLRRSALEALQNDLARGYDENCTPSLRLG